MNELWYSITSKSSVLPNPVCVVGWAPNVVLAFWNKFAGCAWVEGNNEVPGACPNADGVLPKPDVGFPKCCVCPNGLAFAGEFAPNPD